MTTAFWPPTRGDNLFQTQRWNFASGITAANSDRGAFHCKVTATLLELYKDAALASGDKVAEVTGGHGAPSSLTSKTLVAVNSSGLGSVTVDFVYVGADSVFEVYPTLGTDTELETIAIGVSLYPKGGSATTYFAQHKKAMEDLVRKLQNKFSPTPARTLGVRGTQAGSVTDMWVLNARGDWELKKLQNIVAYREYALHRALELIVRQVNRVIPDLETQLRVIEEEAELAEAEFAEVAPLVDYDQDLDADIELPRFRVMRG